MNSSNSLPQKRRYAIIGTGAVGGFYGARLQQSGIEVHFLLHSDYTTVCQQGLTLNSPQGDFTLKSVHAHQTVHTMPRCEVVIVSLKTVHNDLLAHWLPAIIAENGVVLTLQNGLGIEADLAAIVGAQRVMGGLCFLCAHKVAPGHICHLDYGTITLGDYAAGYTAAGINTRMQQIAADWERAGLTMQLTEDLLLTRWKKLIWNIPFNGLSVILNATTAEMMADEAICTLVRQIMQEVVYAAAQCSQRQIPHSFIDKMLTDTAKMKSYKTSMKLDYEHGHPLELESILARPLQLAAQIGLELPKITMLYQQLLFLTRHRN